MAGIAIPSSPNLLPYNSGLLELPVHLAFSGEAISLTLTILEHKMGILVIFLGWSKLC